MITPERPLTALRGHPETVNSVSVVAVLGIAFRRFSARPAATGTLSTCEAASLVFVWQERLPPHHCRMARDQGSPFPARLHYWIPTSRRCDSSGCDQLFTWTDYPADHTPLVHARNATRRRRKRSRRGVSGTAHGIERREGFGRFEPLHLSSVSWPGLVPAPPIAFLPACPRDCRRDKPGDDTVCGSIRPESACDGPGLGSVGGNRRYLLRHGNSYSRYRPAVAFRGQRRSVWFILALRSSRPGATHGKPRPSFHLARTLRHRGAGREP